MAYGYNIKKTEADANVSQKWELSTDAHGCAVFAPGYRTEWTPRGGRRKSRAKARRRNQMHLLSSLTMAAGIFAHPFGVSEAEIVRKDGVSVNPAEHVYNIDPEGTNGNFAYNRFQKFILEQGNIANMRFGDAAALANLVNSRVSIEGIVNAVRNGQIDGHLIFLSPDGIAVGPTGVINAGQFTGIVPAKTDFDKLYNTTNTAEITLTAIENLRDGAYAAVKTDDEGNTVGAIDISGQINTHSGVMLGAGIININDGAKIQSTKNLNFADLVNIKNADGAIAVNAALGSLTAIKGTGGDIILMAKQASEVTDTKTSAGTGSTTGTTGFEGGTSGASTGTTGGTGSTSGASTGSASGSTSSGGTGSSTTGSKSNTIRWSDRSTDITAAINIGTDKTEKGVTITSSDGAVKLSAESASTYEDSTPMTLTDTLKGVIFGDGTFIDGLTDKLAGKEAAANKYLFANYSGKKNKASINIGKKSDIKGTSIDIAATSKLEIKQSIAVPSGSGKKDSNGKAMANDSAAPVAAVAISRVYNNADVVIDGNLTATGADKNGSGIKIAANADTKVALSATAGGGAKTSAVVGVAVLSGDTNAKVSVNANDSANVLKAEQGKVSVEAVTKSDINVNVGAVGSESYVVSNVGVANYDTAAEVTVDRSIQAGAVDIKAENTVAGLKLTVDNTAKPASGSGAGKDTAATTDADKEKDDADADKEKTKPDTKKSESEKKSEKKSIDPAKVAKDSTVNTESGKTKDAKEGVAKVKNKVENSAFGLGTAVGVFSNKNDANVTIGKDAAITATALEGSETANGAVNVAAKTLLSGSGKDSFNLSVKNVPTNSKVEIGAAVLVSNVKNHATILLDSDGAKSAQIKADGAVNMDAAAGMGKIGSSGSESGGSSTTETEEKASVLSYAASAEGTAEEDPPSTFELSGSVGINTLKNSAIVLLGQGSGVDGKEVKLSSDAATGAEGTYGAKGDNAKVGLGATVGIQNISGSSLVMAGKGATIKGTESLEVSASNDMELKNSVQNAGKGDSIGVSGMVALSYGDSNSIVSLDDEAGIEAGFATITSTNSTNIENSARSESTGSEGAKAFGIGVGIVNYDVNSLAMVSDNGSGITAPSEGTTDKDLAAQKIYEDTALARSVAGDTLAGKLGTRTQEGAKKGSITTGGLIGAAVTTGMIQNDAKAKTVSAPPSDEDENERKDSEKWTQWSEKGKDGAKDAKTNTENLEQDKVTSQNESAAPNATGAMEEAGKAADPDGTTNKDDEGAAPVAGSNTSAGASIGVEGSAALTFLGGRTDAVLDNVTVTNGTAEASAPVAVVSLSATDFLGSITLGGTSIKNSVEAVDASTKVGIGGAFAMNSVNRDVDSLIRKSDLPMALMVSNAATKIGIEVAAGMGTSVGDGDGLNINGAGVVYYNKAKQDVHALMIDNNVMGASVSNQATNTDFQIAGGLSGVKGDGANINVGFGGAVAISNLENNLASGIVGGNYTVLSAVDVEAQKGTTQINGALAGTKGGYGFEGAFAYGSTKNTTRAYIDGATVTGLSGSAVNVKAGEVPVVKTDTQINDEKTKIDSKIDSSIGANPNNIDKTKTYTQVDDTTKTKVQTDLKKQADDALDKEKKAQDENKKTLKNAGFDTTGESYLDKTSAQSSLDESVTKGDNGTKTDEGKAADDAAKDEDDAKNELGKNRSITITAAMGGGWNGNAGAGAGIAYNYVKNDIAADIKGSTITADTVNGEAASDSLIVSVGGGVAIGGKTFNGAGSGSWNDLKNDTKVTFENNTITGKSISEQAENSASITNIAGEVAGGKGMALGLSLAYNSLNNTAGTYLTGNDLTLQSEGDGAVNLSTVNTGKTLAVAGGVDVSLTKDSWVGAVGTAAINRGTSDTESVIDGKTSGNTTISGVKALSVTAEELTKKTTVAGGVSVGGKKVGVGGSVAYTSVGSANDKERLRAEVNHADVATTENGTITVSTTDSKKKDDGELEKSRITTVGAGFGVQWGKNFFNLQGGAAVSDIYKDSRASLNNTSINAASADAHPTVSVTADTKSKINTVGVGGSIDIGTAVRGAAGVAINRMYQDTKAEMATSSGTTTVNAGLTEVRATGDGDIHSVGVGGLVGVKGQAVFAGSGSYNYIGNNVDAIVKNQNLKSNSSVGVVAQSDDRLYNFAGGFAIGANTKVGLGAAVSINKITGSTNALVSGGSLAAADSGSVKVTRPQDDNLFTTEKLNLTTDRTKLSENRKEEEKTGIVVDSSATHTLISQLSSGGVAASGNVGINLDGTVNLNTIEGKTTAKIQDAALNTSDKYSNVNVNAVDYTNIGSFTGTPSVGAGAALGLSIGVSTNWETLNRTTAAEISSSSGKKDVYAKNLAVDATAKHGSSALSFAAAAGGGKVGISSGDSIVRHKYSNTVNALMKDVNAEFDGTAEIKADHLANSHMQNISASASGGMVAVSAGAGVSVIDDTTTVKAEVDGSELKAKESKAGKNISVQATNENNWKDTLVTASAAVGIGAGLAANVAINNTSGETSALVTKSNLEAYKVDVTAKDKLTATTTGGVGALGLGGIGVSVALNNINSSVNARVTDGTVTAANDVNVKAEEERKFESSVTGVAVGGIGVGVNVAVTSINKGITEAQLSTTTDENGQSMGTDAGTKNEINVHLNGTTVGDKKYGGVNGAKGALGVDGAKFFGISANSKDLTDAKNVQVSLAVPTSAAGKQGVHTEVSGETMTAAGDVNVSAKDANRIFEKNLEVTVGGGISTSVADNIIHTNYDTDVTMNNASVTGKNVTINATQTDAQTDTGKGSEIEVKAGVGALGIGVGVGYAGIVNRGETDVNITGSTLKGTEKVNVSALDESAHKTNILNVGVSAINVTTTFASVENKNNVGVTLAGTNNISAGTEIAIDAKRANALEAHTQGVGVGGVAVAVNHATIEDGGKDGNRDTGNVTAKITGTNGTFNAEKFHLGATNDATAKLSAGNTTVSILGVSTMRGKGVMDMGAEVSVAGGAFNAKTVEFASMLGNSQGRTIEGNVKGHNISVGAVAPDTVRLETTATGKVDVANSTFGADTNLILDNESYVDRKGYIYDVTVGGVAVGNSRAIISGKETLTTALTGKSGTTNKLNSLGVFAYGQNTGKAFADAGGGSLVGYIGAHVENKSTNTVTSTLGGNWDVAGEVYLLAGQKDEAKLTASEGHGGVIGVGGTSAENTIITNTNTNVADGTVITADRTHIATSNVAVTGAYDDTNEKGVTDAQTYTLKDHFGGAIVGNRLRSLLDLTENGTVTIGKNAKITTNNLQEYVAASDNDLTNHASAKGGGAMAIVDAVTENKINVHNTVDVQSGANLSNEKAASKEGIVLTAYDDQSLKSHVESTVGGLANGLVSINEITMNRTSDVKVAGTIESGSNVGLYAGANATGALSNLNADLKAGTYNYAAFAVTDPQVKYTIAADKGTVAVSGTVRSTADINAIASGGREEVMKDQSLWNWVNGGSSTDKKFLSSSATTAEESSDDMKKSTVNVTGALIAGTAAPINVTIGGSVANGLTITADDNRANQRVKAGITQGTFDYANTLGARLTKLNELIAAYDDNSDATVLASYIAERTRIQKEMADQGLVERDANGNITAYLNSGRPVYYVEIPDIATGGGNINVTANHFTGTGTLEANSAPGVAITNQSDAYLKLNNILMGEQGGKIVYNQDNVIPPGESQGNAAINNINVGKTGASFGKIYGVVNGEAANLLVRNTFSGERTSTISLTPKLEQEINATDLTADEKEQYKQDIRNGKMTYTAIPDVEVNGKISNFYGQVEINNTSGNIRISGGTQDRPTGVEGNTVKLIAGNGSIAQDYKEGIVNINGDPEKYYATQAQSLKDPVYNIYKSSQFQTSSWQTRKTDCARTDDSRVATGYIAGRDVYVSAANINVNGLIQSGYKNYTATVTVDDLNAAKTRPADNAAVVQNRTMYKVNKGGATWNETEQAFDYVPQVYWDPSTDQLFVENIDTAGGKVYLTGKIASTGDGKILAADGAADISVENKTALDMNVGSVLNNQREGVITIADTAKDTWTEYKKGQTRSITGYSEYLKENAKKDDLYANATVTTDADKVLSVDSTLTYNPKAKQAYTWIEGATTETSATYEHYERRGFWGLVQTADTTQLKEWENNSKPVEPAKLRELGLPSGATIEQDFNYHNFFTDDQAKYLNDVNKLDVTKYAQEANQLWLYSQNNVKATWTYGHEHWVTRSGFLGWFKHIHDRWKTGSNTVQFYQYSLNASQPITIGLIGSEVGKIDIKSTNAGGGNINLTGNVANSHNEATLAINSAAGGITQFDNTTLKSEVVNLEAKNNISNIHLASIGTAVKDANGAVVSVTDNIKLSAVSTGKGNIDVTAVGGILENRSLPGNVEIVALKSQNGNAAFASDAALGDVALTANGNIIQSGNGTTVEGRGVTLTSKEGGIGTPAQAVNIAGSDLVYSTNRYGAQVNASANGNIYLTEAAAGGDMRVGKIESRTGDVTLTVQNGGFLDALPNDNNAKSTESVDDMVHRWIDAGLIAGENGYEGAYIRDLKKNRDDYAARITSDYEAYTAKKNATNAVFDSSDYKDYKNGTGAYAGMTDAQKSAKLLADGHQDYLTYKDYATADDYLKTSDGYKFNSYESADAYLAADAKYQDLKNKAENPTYEWTKDMMLYAVSDKLVNPESGGSAQTARAANVLGRNVTLTSTQGKVGNVSDTSTEITVEQLTGNDKITHMKALMNMDASDVKAVRDDNGKLTKFVITPNMPLGVKATGTLDVQAGGDVSVAGRTDAAGEHSAINVGTVDATNNNATGDVRLYSDKGITNALEAADGINIKGNNLILAGGKESIGASDKPLTVSLSGDLVQARADKNVFIKNMNDSDWLRLGSLYAADTISLASEKGFKMSSANSGIAESYINAGKKLEFNTNVNTGIVGDATHAIRILNDRAPVNIAAKSAYIKGVNSSSVQNDTLVLGTVDTQEEFVAESEGSLTVGREKDKDKEAVTGNVKTGGDATLSAANDLTLDGKVAAGTQESGKTLTLKAVNGNITQTAKGAITADEVKTFNGKSLLLENAENQFNRITVDGIETESGEKPDIDGDVRIKDHADDLIVAVRRKVAGDISAENLRESGTLANEGDIVAAGSISLATDGSLTQAANTTLSAGKDVALTSRKDGISQDGTAGIQAQTVTAVSAKAVDLQGAGNAFSALTVQSADGSAPLQGSVSVKDSADKLTLSIQPAVNGDITAENTKEQGVLQVISELQADGDGDSAKGDVTLASGGSMQTDKKITAANDVKLTSANGDVSIRGDIFTGTRRPGGIDESGALGRPYNSLLIHAGGAISEAAGVKIETPVVETYSGKGVSLESENNRFETFLADALEGRNAIGGSVKVVSDYAAGADSAFTAGVGASIQGDAKFFNRNKDGNLNVLIWNPDDDTKEIKTEGSLVLSAGKDVRLLGDAVAKQDILADSTNGGSFYGIGKGMKAGHDVRVSAGDAVYYIGTLEAGNDIRIQAQSASTEDAGIYIGALPEGAGTSDRATSLKAGKDVQFAVTGNGDIHLEGNVVAETGAASANISGKGSIFVGEKGPLGEKTITAQKDVSLGTKEGNIRLSKSIQSKDESVSVQTEKGDIHIGAENVADDETITAKKNASIGTDLGTIYILGKTITQDGDITMKAGKEVYEGGIEAGNFIIQEDGKLVSGGAIGLYGRNGDIYITDDIEAKKGITASIAEQGNAVFARDVNVTENVDISTDKGSIAVGHEVNAEEGTVRLQTGTGDVLVGKDITAGAGVAISSRQGNVLVGDESLGDAGNVLAKTGNVSIRTGQGNVDIVKTVTAQEGSLDISSGKGDILIGNNGPDVKTVTARDNLSLATKDGKVVVYGKTSTEKGDISISARRQEYIPGADNRSFIIDQNGKLESGGAIYLDVGNGDLHVSDRIQAQRDLVAELKEKGSVYFDTDVNVNGIVSVKTTDGDINVGHDVRATNDIAMTTGTGDINVGAAVASAGGDVDLAAHRGDVNIGKEVRADAGSIGVRVGAGEVNIGDNGPDVETVTARKNIDVAVDLGKIRIYGKTSTKEGDISMSAAESQYVSGEQNIIIAQNGLLESGRDINLKGRNGDLRVTDAVQAKRNLHAQVTDKGGISYDTTVNVNGELVSQTEDGRIVIVGEATGNYVELGADNGSISVGGDLVSNTNANVDTWNGDISLEDVTAGNAVNIHTGNGDLSAGSIHAGGDANITVGNGDADIGTVNAGGNAAIDVSGGDLSAGDITARGDAGITVSGGDADVGTVKAGGDAAIDVSGGDLSAGNITAGGDAGITVSGGNLSVEDIDAGGDASVTVDSGDAVMGTVDAGENAGIEVTGGGLSAGDITAGGNATVAVRGGDAGIGTVDAGVNAGIRVVNGRLSAEDITAGSNARVDVRGGDAGIGTVNAGNDAAIRVENGDLDLDSMRAGSDASIHVSEGNLTAGDVAAGHDANVTVQNGNIQMHDVTAAQDATVSSEGSGSINGNNVVAGEIAHVSLSNGDLFLNLAEGKAVFLQMENNTEASKVKEVRANASGGTGPDVGMTGNFIRIGSLAAKDGDAVFELSAMGAGNQKLIAGDFQVDSLRSKRGSHMPTLWANRGHLHVDEGDLAQDDVLAVDKIQLDNAATDLSIYGRTPTRDGEQLAYWNNLDLANDKQRSFQLYSDGRVRTRGAILIDAGRNYGKLYGDNLSVVDMMRERVSSAHGQYTFDSTLLTEPGRRMSEPVFFGMESLDVNIREQNAPDAEIVVE